MALLYHKGLTLLVLAAVFFSGFFYGRMSIREKTLHDAIIAFQNRERINDELKTP